MAIANPVGDHSRAGFATWPTFERIRASKCPTLDPPCVFEQLEIHYHISFKEEDVARAVGVWRKTKSLAPFDELGPIFHKGVNCYEVDSFEEWAQNCLPYLKRISLGERMADLSLHKIWEVKGVVIAREKENLDLKRCIVVAQSADDITEQIKPIMATK